ncbi:MBL fold metallo-hydrolase [Listeria floridensis]|uniref:MBL fold metallo-hydrolase n=1 Tax=Listeria floridensis TaxID=1494962 RepID=UPI001F4C70B5|nr:MBL fold metallo-hydrolase [Listeria floridensis]
MINYEIVSSGSKGNCVIIEDVMIDCGVPFQKIKARLYEIRYLLLTHIHSDHIKPSTLKRIKELFPKIKIIANYEVAQTYGVDIISNNGYPIELQNYEFLPFECVHNVITQGFAWRKNNKDIIYATDTSSLKHAPKKAI